MTEVEGDKVKPGGTRVAGGDLCVSCAFSVHEVPGEIPRKIVCSWLGMEERRRQLLTRWNSYPAAAGKGLIPEPGILFTFLRTLRFSSPFYYTSCLENLFSLLS